MDTGIWAQAGADAVLGLDVSTGPAAEATTQYLGYLVEQYAAKKYLAVVWDNASWHKAAHVQQWLEHHNATAVPRQRPKVFVF